MPKWSLKDWTIKDVLKSDEKIKKPYLLWPGTDMVFWSFCHFGYIDIKYFTSTGLKNVLKSDIKIEKTISTLAWYRYGFLKKKVLWPTE